MLHFGDAIGEHFSAFNFFHFFNVTNFSIPGMSITFNKTINPLVLNEGVLLCLKYSVVKIINLHCVLNFA